MRKVSGYILHEYEDKVKISNTRRNISDGESLCYGAYIEATKPIKKGRAG